MIHPDALGNAEAYITQQAELAPTVPNDELPGFVMKSVEGLAVGHMIPAVQGICEDLVGGPRSEEHRFVEALINSASMAIVDPPSLEWPISVYTKDEQACTGGLWLVGDGSLTKVYVASSGLVPQIAGDAAMHIVRYTPASPQESATYGTSYRGVPIKPGTTIIVPRRDVEYRNSEGVRDCVAKAYGGPDHLIHLYTGGETPPRSNLLKMHAMFMHESSLALIGLHSIAPQQ